jgi:hypothetical protein
MKYEPITEKTEINDGDWIREPQADGAYRNIQVENFDSENDRYNVLWEGQELPFDFYMSKESMINLECEIKIS